MNIKNKILKSDHNENSKKNEELKIIKDEFRSDKKNKKIISEKENNLDKSKKNLEEHDRKNNTSIEKNPEQDQLTNLEEEISKLREEKLRLLAEMENIRKRFAKEKSEAIRFGSTNLARDILSPNDNLIRALENIPDNKSLTEPIKNLVNGLEMVQKEFTNILEKHGVKKIDALNNKFDHNLHQAMLEIETEKKEKGIVVQEIQSGYTMYDRLLRPAMVGVSKKPKKNKEKK